MQHFGTLSMFSKHLLDEQANTLPPSEILQWEIQPSRGVADFYSHVPALPVGSLPMTPFRIVTINIHICTDDPEMSLTISRELQSLYFIAAVLLSFFLSWLRRWNSPQRFDPNQYYCASLKESLIKSGECGAAPQTGEPICYKKKLGASMCHSLS